MLLRLIMVYDSCVWCFSPGVPCHFSVLITIAKEVLKFGLRLECIR